jgi:hypothetical protein
LAGLDVLLRILPDLTVDLGTLAIFLQEVIVHAVEVPLLLVCGAVGVVIQVFADLALGILVVGEEVGDGNTRRGALDLGAPLLLLLGFALLLLFGGCRAIVLVALFLIALVRAGLRSGGHALYEHTAQSLTSGSPGIRSTFALFLVVIRIILRFI